MNRKHRIGVIRFSYQQKPGLQEYYPKEGLSDMFIGYFKTDLQTYTHQSNKDIDPYSIYGAPAETFDTISRVLTYARIRTSIEIGESWILKAVLIT